MPLIGWMFILLAAALVLGSLFMLRDSANMPLSEEKRKKIRKRQAELEAEEEKSGVMNDCRLVPGVNRAFRPTDFPVHPGQPE